MSWIDGFVGPGFEAIGSKEAFSPTGAAAITAANKKYEGHLRVIPTGRSTHFFNNHGTMQFLDFLTLAIRQKRAWIREKFGVPEENGCSRAVGRGAMPVGSNISAPAYSMGKGDQRIHCRGSGWHVSSWPAERRVAPIPVMRLGTNAACITAHVL